MIKAIINKGIIKFAQKYITKDSSKAVITYIVRDVETEKDKGSIFVKDFVAATAEPFKVGDIISVVGNLFEQFKRENGQIVKDEKGHFITERWEILVNTIELLPPEPKKEPKEETKEEPKSQPTESLPFDLTEEQKAQLTPEMRKTLGL